MIHDDSPVPDVAEVTATAWELMRADHTRDPRDVGSSQIAKCVGELGYLLSGTEFTDPAAATAARARVGKDALIGIAIHDAILPYVVDAWRALGAIHADHEVEVDATIDGVRLVGHLDAKAEVAEKTVDILELKTVSENVWTERLNARTPKTDHLLQGADYCARYEQAHPGVRVNDLTIWYVNRNHNSNDLHYTLPYRSQPVPGSGGRDMATWISDRHALLSEAVRDPDKVKKEYRYCGDCGFQTRCLGKPRASENADDVVRDDAVSDIVRAAKQSRQARKEHDKEYKKYKQLLDDLGPDDGIYTDDTGQHHKLRWKNGGETIDHDVIREWFFDRHADNPIVTDFMERHRGALPTKFRAGSWSM